MKDYSREIIVSTGQGIFCEFRSLKKVITKLNTRGVYF